MIVKSHLDAGAKSQIPKIIVVHAMGEYIIGNGWKKHAIPFLNELPTPLSAHSIIGSDGTNYRCRDDNEGAYHAKGFNTDSLGIEFLVEGEHNYTTFLNRIKTPYLSSKEYEEGVIQVIEWLDIWDIEKLVRHSDLSPERKVDPGEGFPWEQFLKDVGWPK